MTFKILILFWVFLISFTAGKYYESYMLKRHFKTYDTIVLNNEKIWCDVYQWRNSE